MILIKIYFVIKYNWKAKNMHTQHKCLALNSIYHLIWNKSYAKFNFLKKKFHHSFECRIPYEEINDNNFFPALYFIVGS